MAEDQGRTDDTEKSGEGDLDPKDDGVKGASTGSPDSGASLDSKALPDSGTSPRLDASDDLDASLGSNVSLSVDGGVVADGQGATEPGPPKKRRKKKTAKKSNSGLGSSRGIETMFRTSYRVHQDLVGLADTKANIMISVNGLIISIILAAVAPRIAAAPLLAIPTFILLIGCVIALVYAVLAARPRVSNVPLTLDDIARNDANILFFGNFVNLTEAEFVEGMRNLMMTQDHLYVNMVRDLYGLGQVLKTKFELLRISYTVFMYALAIGVGLFVVVLALDATMTGGLLEIGGALPLLP